MGAIRDAALPLPDEIVRPVHARASAAAVAQVGAVTGVHPSGTVIGACVLAPEFMRPTAV